MRTRITHDEQAEKKQMETRVPLTLVEMNLHWIVKVGVAKRMQKTRKNLSFSRK